MSIYYKSHDFLVWLWLWAVVVGCIEKEKIISKPLNLNINLRNLPKVIHPIFMKRHCRRFIELVSFSFCWILDENFLHVSERGKEERRWSKMQLTHFSYTYYSKLTRTGNRKYVMAKQPKKEKKNTSTTLLWYSIKSYATVNFFQTVFSPHPKTTKPKSIPLINSTSFRARILIPCHFSLAHSILTYIYIDSITSRSSER